MKKNILTLTGSICFLLIGILCNAQNAGTLTIEATNFKNNNGKATIHLFRVQDDIPRKPFMQMTSDILNGKATILFPNIPYGDYAVILFQDENANGILDHKLGFPNEPMGFSNDWKLSLFSGMPTFEKLKFEFSAQKSNCKVAIH